MKLKGIITGVIIAILVVSPAISVSVFALPPAVGAFANNDDVNSDGTTNNDIPPDGEGLFCDHPSNPGGCYDRNDNPEEFCVNHQQYTLFCETLNRHYSYISQVEFLIVHHHCQHGTSFSCTVPIG